jgi:hypothetical protein
MTERPKIETVQQGKTVVEKDDGGYLIMHPDGNIAGASTKARAEVIARRWYRANLGDHGCKMGIGEIEWRE